MAIQTKQQKRAKFALNKVLEYKKPSKDDAEFHELANFIVGMPNMILSNGLGQTLAFLLTKKDKQKKTFNIIKEWVQSSENKFDIQGKSEMEFLTAFSEIDQRKYVDMQDETLRLMEWLKRYARAFDEKGKEVDYGKGL